MNDLQAGRIVAYQRTPDEHTGVPMQLRLDIEKAGEHELLMSMREDGMEVDQIALAGDVKWRPDGVKEASPHAAKKRPEGKDGDGSVSVTGGLKQWHKVTLMLDGLFAWELDSHPNPFTDCRMTVTFTRESGTLTYRVPGYFVADGDVGNSSADHGTKWRACLSPDKPGLWKYTVQYARGANLRHSKAGGEPVAAFDGESGQFTVGVTDKTGVDFPGKGRLQYVGKHYLQFAGTGEYFIKFGPETPKTLLALGNHLMSMSPQNKRVMNDNVFEGSAHAAVSLAASAGSD